MRISAGMAAIALSAAAATPVSAGWTVVNLSPPTVGSSYAYSVSCGQQVGRVYDGWCYYRAVVWNGSATSWSYLAAQDSEANGVSAGQQVGQTTVTGQGVHAALWHGTASWVDLHPSGAYTSSATGASGTQQVGYAYVIYANHASLWSGTAGSWVDLHPPGATASEAAGVSGGQQVGYAVVGNVPRASLWSGTAASWVDLSPVLPGNTRANSFAYAISGTQQVGCASIGGNYHAGMWNGNAASWVDLSPAGATRSFARAISGGRQAGFALIGANYHAGLWSGSADSWVDLAALLPAGKYSDSYAYGIEVRGGQIWVVGYAHESAGDDKAMLWHYTPDPPPTYYGITNKAAYDLTTAKASAIYGFRVWGKVTAVVAGESLTLDDGSGRPVVVASQGLSGIEIGDHVCASGSFSGEGSDRVLCAQASDVHKLR